MAEVSENDRIAGPFIAAAGQIDFPADFPLLKGEGLRFRRERSGEVTTLSPPAISAVDPGSDGFTCRLASPSADGDICWVYSQLPPARLRQHTPNGAVRSPTLEGDAMEFQAQLQEQRAILARTFALPFGEAGSELPRAEVRAGRFAKFDDAGALVGGPAPQDFEGLNKVNKDVSNLDPSEKIAFNAELATRAVAPEAFVLPGDIGDQPSWDRWVAYRADTGAPGKLSGRTYSLSTVSYSNIGAGVILAEPGAAIEGAINRAPDTRIVGESVALRFDNGTVTYDDVLSPSFLRPPDQKQVWLDTGADRTRMVRIDPTTIRMARVAWPDGQTWTTEVPPAVGVTSEEGVAWNLTNDGQFHAGFVNIRPGDELSGAFGYSDAPDYNRGVLLRCSTGWLVFYFGYDSVGQLSLVPAGEAVATTVHEWAGSEHQFGFKSGKGRWSVRLYDYRTFSIALNGFDVVGPMTLPASMGYVLDAGFGAYGGVALTVGVSWWNLARRDHAVGRAPLRIAEFGDSKRERYNGASPVAMLDALDGLYGLRVDDFENYAEGGHTAEQQWAVMQTVNLTAYNHVDIAVGTNNIQGAAAAATTRATVKLMIQAAQAAGCTVVVTVPGLWYSSVTPGAGGKGLTTQREGEGAEIRSALANLCAEMNVGMVDEAEVLGPCLADYHLLSDWTVTRWKDAIHYSAFAGLLMGVAVARMIAAVRAPAIDGHLSDATVPANMMRNSWAAYAGTGEALRLSIEPAGRRRRVTLGGALSGGTGAYGTVMIELPPPLRPAVTHRYRVPGGGTASYAIQVDSSGAVTLFTDLTPGDFIALDGVSFLAAD